MQKTLYRNKCYIDKFYYCPFYKKGIVKKYRKDSFDRKPAHPVTKIISYQSIKII